jgi:hypothetical protein
VAQLPPEWVALYHRNEWHCITGMSGTITSGICRLFKKYNISNYHDWINTFWGVDDFFNPLITNYIINNLEIKFETNWTNSKIFIVTLQMKYPEIKIFSQFDYSDGSYEIFNTTNNGSVIYFQSNNNEWKKYTNSMELRRTEFNENNRIYYKNIA